MTSNVKASFHLGPVSSEWNLNNPFSVMVDLNEEKDKGEPKCPIKKGAELYIDQLSSQQNIEEDVNLCTNLFSSQQKIGGNMDIFTNQVSSEIKDLEHVIPSSQLEQIELQTAASLSSVNEIKIFVCGIDLNKKPQHRARKRKHRPKVIKDVDAKKTSKPVVPKQATPTNQKQPLPKRKYVRRKGIKPSVTCSVNELTDDKSKASTTISVDLRDAASLSGEPHRQSCKRYLHFDLEGQDEDKCPQMLPVQMDRPNDNTASATNTNSVVWDFGYQSSQTQDCTNFGQSSGSESNVQLLKEIEKSHIGIAFDMTFHQNEKLKDYLFLPEEPNLSLITEALDKNVEKGALVNGGDATPYKMSQYACPHVEDAAGIECITLQNMSGDANVVLTESNQERKRIGRDVEDDCDFHSVNFPQIYKKKRTTSCKRSMFQTIIVTPSMLQGHCEVKNENSIYPMAGERQHPQQEFVEPQLEVPINHKKLLDDILGLPIERRIKKKRNVSYRIRRIPTMKIAAGENDKLHRKASSSFCGPQSCVEALNAENNANMITKKRTRKERTSHHASSMSNNLQMVPMVHGIHNSSSRSHPHTVFGVNSPSQASSLDEHPLEDLIQKFICLSINGDSKTDMTMVPFEGLFKKKRRPRAKVNLDPETDRVWKLLMWKESSDGAEKNDSENEKYWEEERSVLRGRVESFIAKMHLVQGDRGFSQWKGSVVDSVIGVFLTQNVSDHLSSSAFMALAAKFPTRSQNRSRGPDVEAPNKSAEDEQECTLDSDGNIKLDNIKSYQCSENPQEAEPIGKETDDSIKSGNIESYQCSETTGEAEPIGKATDDNIKLDNLKSYQCSETPQEANLSESYGSSMEDNKAVYSDGKLLDTSESGQEMCQESLKNVTDTTVVVTESTNFEGAEDMKGHEDFVSSQVSSVSSQISTDSAIFRSDRVISSSESNSEKDYPADYPCFPSFTELLQSQIVGSNRPKEPLKDEDSDVHFDETAEFVTGQSDSMELEKRNSSFSGMSCLNGSCPTFYPSQSMHYKEEMRAISYSGYQLHSSPGSSGTVELGSVEASGDESRCSLLPNNSESIEVDDICCAEKRIDLEVKTVTESMIHQNKLRGDQITTGDQIAAGASFAHKSKHPSHEIGAPHEENLATCNNLPSEKMELSLGKDTPSTWSESRFGQILKPPQKQMEGDPELEITEVIGLGNVVEELAQMQNSRTQQTSSNLPKYLGETSEVSECSSLVEKQQPIHRMGVESNAKEASSSENMSKKRTDNKTQVKKERRPTEKKDFDWDSLRKQVCQDGLQKERSNDRMDSVDWEAVRLADEDLISFTIKERGMNNRLAQRIKNFLNRLVRDHGSIDLEWLRDIPPDKTKDYLLSIWGLGLKSVECIRLLTLHHLAFPVDTNVGRICVRLGWVPIEPLPESLQLHLLELYPYQEKIQKYLWPRLCTLDQRTLYELHYQMITFGKVFCTKSKPNCNACPMRAECRHFASAFASARLALPGPEERRIINLSVPVTPEVPVTPLVHFKLVIDPLPLPPMEGQPSSEVGLVNNSCVPIIEEPPEYDNLRVSDNDIEDDFWGSDEIPTIKLNVETLATNVQDYVQQNNIDNQYGDMSKALVALTPEAASIPMPKFKNVSRLRTEHQVYELPDSHPLLAGLDRREPDDPCSYLLVIWTPGETANSTEPPEFCCNSQESGDLCDREACFTCSCVREAQMQTVRGTLLIPCRTAMRGSFPLNGTYFQVNEVFADDHSSRNPINVPRALIWNLPRRTVYFGTSVTSIFKGLTTEEIQQCFWRGYVCVRGFDQKERAPRPLNPRLHFPASKLSKTRKAAKSKAAETKVK